MLLDKGLSKSYLAPCQQTWALPNSDPCCGRWEGSGLVLPVGILVISPSNNVLVSCHGQICGGSSLRINSEVMGSVRKGIKAVKALASPSPTRRESYWVTYPHGCAFETFDSSSANSPPLKYRLYIYCLYYLSISILPHFLNFFGRGGGLLVLHGQLVCPFVKGRKIKKKNVHSHMSTRIVCVWNERVHVISILFP